MRSRTYPNQESAFLYGNAGSGVHLSIIDHHLDQRNNSRFTEDRKGSRPWGKKFYGAEFMGLSEIDMFRIEVYEELEKSEIM